MKIVDRGGGTPVVVIPGIQGRWEWMAPAIDALAPRCRVVTFSLADEPTCAGRFEEARGFDCYVEQVREALDAAGLSRAAICGVSYGGLIAAAFAARYPDRVASLVMVSAVPPSWQPDTRVRFYLQAPRLLTPLFLIASLRMYREIAAANGGYVRGAAAGIRHGWRVLTHMFSPVRMARRVRFLPPAQLQHDLEALHVPTLIITGERKLDRIVPVDRTREYRRLWPHAETVTIQHTGHLGLITRPQEFARVVASFAKSVERDADTRRRVG
jgi:pimeloyl-ACP methyl ester carboxylesterase